MAVLIGLLLGQMLGVLAVPGSAMAMGANVYISELQTGDAVSANDEFIELYNGTNVDVSVANWQLQYRSATAANGSDCGAKVWSKLATLPNKTIKAHGYFLLASNGYPLLADATFSAGMASTAGTLQLVNAVQAASPVVIDALAWGDGACGHGQPAMFSSGQSLERLPGADAANGGNSYDSANNVADFMIRSTPEPQSSKATVEAPLAVADMTAGDSNGQLELSEVLPVPRSGNPMFVEFHNTGSTAVVLSSYSLAVGAVRYALPPHVLLPDGYVAINSDTFPFSLPAAGSVSLIDAAGASIDDTAWNGAPKSASWIRDGGLWTWTATPTPAAANLFAPLASDDPHQGEADSSNYPELQITELLPNPAPPATDASDEFIELYNPNPSTINLRGYILKTGQAWGNHYTLPDEQLAPGGYIAFKSAQSHLPLSNSGTNVGLFDPADNQIGATITYGAASEGQAWAKFDAGWAWTITPTPASANLLATAGAGAGVSTKVKATAAPKVHATAKPAATKPVKAKQPAKPKAKVATTAKPKPVLSAAQASGPWLLFALASLTICYVIYEFRYDLLSYYHKLRGYSTSGRSAGTALAGRGSDRAQQRSRRGQDHVRPGVSA
ncbi:MAG TPA: lamin tail domain-containing protein [Candidatus Saccharimonadia bacterium]|nr:lamin tail domain-containing protein [Candidatus Saccharimonadia bacterium]